MDRKDLKKDITERIKNGDIKDFEIEKVQLSKNDPILKSTKKLVGGVDPDYVVKQARDFLNAPVDKDFRYPGRRTRTVIKVVETPGKFYGIKLGKLRIGVFIEVEGEQ